MIYDLPFPASGAPWPGTHSSPVVRPPSPERRAPTCSPAAQRPSGPAAGSDEGPVTSPDAQPGRAAARRAWGGQSRATSHGQVAAGAGPNHKSNIINHKCEAVAKDFESVLLTKLFDQVQASLGHWDLEEDGTSQQVQGLFWLHLAREVADKGGLGLWKDIYRHLQQMGDLSSLAGLMDEEL